MKHQPEDNVDISHGCPITTMRNPEIKAAFEEMIKTTKSHLSLHMNNNAPHYSSKDTRIAYHKFVGDI